MFVPASSPALKVAARVQAFDWLRGLAVLFMIQCHAMVMLLPALQEDPFFRTLVRLDGLVAPAFTFSAGFSLALVQVRGAAQGSRWIRALKSLRRITEVLLIASLVNLAWFPIFREPKWLIRLDILHCLGLSLVLLLPMLVVLAGRPAVLRWVALAMAALTFAVSPLLETNAAPFDWLLNATTGSLFPLLPWAGYVYLGASAGATAARGDLWALVRWLVMIGVTGAVLWIASPQGRPTDYLVAVYPHHNFWVTNPANCGQRWAMIIGVLLAMLAFEQKGQQWVKSRPVKFVTAFGTSSMAAYFFHQMLLFFRLPFGYLTTFGFSFKSWWGESCGWVKYFALTALLIAITWVLVVLTDRVYKKLDAKLPSLTPKKATP